MKKRIGIITLIIAFCVSIAYAVPPTPPVSGLTDASNVAITGGSATGMTSVEATTVKADHIGEKTSAHGVVVDNNLEIGSTTAGKNLTVQATEGAEMTPALESANWTLGTDGTGGWAASGGVLSKTASAGTQTATPSGTFTVVAGRTYRVTMVVSAASGSPTYTIGGRQGTTITATTISEDIIAGTTGKIIFSGGASATCTITSLSVKELTPSTGGATVDGALIVRNQLMLPYGGATIQPTLAFGSNRTGLNESSGDLHMILGGVNRHEMTSSYHGILIDNASIRLGANMDVFIARDAADTLALRRSTNQQMLRIYNTYTDASNYERMSLTGVAGSSINITAATAGTGSDNLDIVLTPAGTGTVKTASSIFPVTDDTYYLGKNDDDSPAAWKGVILKDTANGKYYRIEITNGTIVATDLTD